MDFAQNFLPVKHHETQGDYFGKQGIVWHISHVITNINGQYAHHTFMHFMENNEKVLFFKNVRITKNFRIPIWF